MPDRAAARLIASACVVALVVAAGCAHENDASSAPAPVDDGAPLANPYADASREEPFDECTLECPPARCNVLTAEDLDEQIGWKPATAHPGACSDAEIAQLGTNFEDTSLMSWFDLGKGLGDGCKACVLSNDTDASWQIIVGTAQTNGQTGFIDFGACFGFVEGPPCGKSLQDEQFCYNVVCNSACSTSTERQNCVQKEGAPGGHCAAFRDATSKTCPNLEETAKSCNTVFDAVRTLCGSPLADAGDEGG